MSFVIHAFLLLVCIIESIPMRIDQDRIESISPGILAQRNSFELNPWALCTPGPTLHLTLLKSNQHAVFSRCCPFLSYEIMSIQDTPKQL